MFRSAVLALVCCELAACSSIPQGKSAIDKIQVVNNDALSDSEILEKLASQESGKFLWLFQGLLVEYEVFNPHVLQRDLQRVERYYRARGYHHARAVAGRVFRTDDDHVRIEIHVKEGLPTLVNAVEITGIDELPQAEQDAVRVVIADQTGVGQTFEEERFRAAEAGARRALANRGYAYAEVNAEAFVDIPRRSARVVYQALPKEKSWFGQVSISGLEKIPEAPVRRALNITRGEPYSKEVLEDAKQALLDLGVFAAVDVDPQLEDPPPRDHIVPVQVRVVPAPLKSVELGGGLQLDVIQSGVHAIAGWEHRNLFGGLRKFRVELRPGLLFYPTRLPDFEAPEALLPVVGVDSRFEQPGFLEPRTVGIVSGGYDVFAVLFLSRGNPNAPIVGYRESRVSGALKRRFYKLTVTPSLNVQTDVPFAYRGELSEEATAVYIFYSEIDARLDLRDHSISPTRGAYGSVVAQYADFGGDANDFRIQPEVRFYVPVPGAKANIALRAATGFLFPFNYRTYDSAAVGDGAPPVKDTQVAYFRSFFSGGPNSNRGYPYRGVGPHGPVEFFNPALASQQTNCDPSAPNYDDEACSFPLGGRSLWEASVAFRFKVSGSFASALFCDASDVLLQEFTLEFSRPHLSCGTGLRYATPVGPIRFDLGYRIPGLQVLGEATRIEGDPGTIFGLPLNASFGIGEAF